MSIFNSRDKNGNLYMDSLELVEDIPGFSKNTTLRLKLLADGRLEISEPFTKKPYAYLKYSQITNTGIIHQKEFVEVDKNVIGRAIVGGLLLGSLGAEIGGISGIGKKQKEEHNWYFIINYFSSSSEEPKVLGFKLTSFAFMDDLKKFELELRNNIGLPEKKEPEEYNL